MALLAAPGDAAALRARLEATRDAAAGCPPGHPRRAAILLRTAAALAVNAQAAYAPGAVDAGIDVLAEALRAAGLDTFAERSRCLYGLGYTLLIRVLAPPARAPTSVSPSPPSRRPGRAWNQSRATRSWCRCCACSPGHIARRESAARG